MLVTKPMPDELNRILCGGGEMWGRQNRGIILKSPQQNLFKPRTV